MFEIDHAPPGSISQVGSETPADLLASVRRTAEGFFAKAHGSHDWDHTLRVARLCERIGPMEGADMLVVRMAAYLHDIGRAEQDRSHGAVCHAARGAELVQSIVADLPLRQDQRDNIVHCVRAHRFRDGFRPQTREAEVLFDADKLDAIGAVGVARAYQFAGELGACLHSDLSPEASSAYSRHDTGYREYIVKLSKIRDRIITAEGRRLAAERHAFMVDFFNRFIEEYEGRS
jgi:uncharacterized protein